MVVKRPIDEYLQKALDAEECARNTTDSEMRASWCGIAFGYRELARFRKEDVFRKDGVRGQPAPADMLSGPRPDSLPHR